MRLCSSKILATFLMLAACPVLAPGAVLASELTTTDIGPIVDNVSTMAGRQELMELDLYNLGDDVTALRQDLQVTSENELVEVRGLREDVASAALTDEERRAIAGLSALGEDLAAIRDAVAPDVETETSEGEGQPEVETTEVEGQPEVKPAILDDVAQLLMINTATLALLLGVQVGRPLHDVLSGMIGHG